MRSEKRYVLGALVAAALIAAVASRGPAATATGPYKRVNLMADRLSLAHRRNPKLLNPWGIASLGGGDPFWINDEGSGLSQLVDGAGKLFPRLPSVTIPPPAGQPGPSRPTGIVANNTQNAFLLPDNNPAAFIFDTLDGTISGWDQGKKAVLLVDNSAQASYTGLAIATDKNGATFLYAANEHGGIDVFDTTFKPVKAAGGFADPALPAGLVPYGIANVDGNVFVTYTRPFAMNAVVDEFDPDGNLIMEFAKDGKLNAPWAVVMAPANFGPFSNDILIGNFGDGAINAFNPTTGEFLGQLTNASGHPLQIAGLWGLMVGAGVRGVTNPNAVYFTAGPNGERDGIFGLIEPGPPRKPRRSHPTPTPQSTSVPNPTPTYVYPY